MSYHVLNVRPLNTVGKFRALGLLRGVRNTLQITALLLICAVSFALAAELTPAALPSADEVYPEPFDWRDFRVLHIGDSQVFAGLADGLRRRFRHAHASYKLEGWVGSRSKSWVVSGKLRRLLDDFAPHAVIVTLGTNAISHPKPEVYAGWVRKLVEKIGPRQCYWIGPPPVIDDENGFNDQLREACGKCRYFDSRPMELPPRHDGKFHLTRQEGEMWAGQVWDWMNTPGNRPPSERSARAL